MKHWWRQPLLGVASFILIVGAFQLTRAGYSVDEQFTVFAVRGIQVEGLPLLPSKLLYDRGLAYSYASWVAGAVSNSELPAYRALSLLSALASVLLMLTIVRRLATHRAARLAAALVAISLPFWATATTGRFYAPFLAAYLFGLFVLAKVHTEDATRTLLLGLVAAATVGRWLHELEFTIVGIPLLCAAFGPRS